MSPQRRLPQTNSRVPTTATGTAYAHRDGTRTAHTSQISVTAVFSTTRNSAAIARTITLSDAAYSAYPIRFITLATV